VPTLRGETAGNGQLHKKTDKYEGIYLRKQGYKADLGFPKEGWNWLCKRAKDKIMRKGNREGRGRGRIRYGYRDSKRK
jgi:hypothetical protein